MRDVNLCDDIGKLNNHINVRIATRNGSGNFQILHYCLTQALMSYSKNGLVSFADDDSRFDKCVKIILVKGAYDAEINAIFYDLKIFLERLQEHFHDLTEKLKSSQVNLSQDVVTMSESAGVTTMIGISSADGSFDFLSSLHDALKKYSSNGHVTFHPNDDYRDVWIKLILVKGMYDASHRAIVFDVHGFYDQLEVHINEAEQNSGLMITGGGE